LSALRRQFVLPEADLEYLEGRGLPWETVIEGNTRWVLVHRYPLVSGYSIERTSIALELSPSYPDTHINMVYFCPHLCRNDGGIIRQLSSRSIDGQDWQRWSRHRTKENPWRRGYDCIETHLLLVDEWVQREFRGTA
jgi:hypothetical protein